LLIDIRVFSIGLPPSFAEPALIRGGKQAQTISEGRIDDPDPAPAGGPVVGLGGLAWELLRYAAGHPLHCT